jgi:23S rRNA pseudouridine1911/1915/1917 synthase
MVVAKHEKAHSALSEAFKSRLVKKHYLALCVGNPGQKVIKNHLGRDLKDRKKFAICQTGKEAISSIETLAFNKGYSLVKVAPETGRTHQIRLHMQSTGCFIVGDPLYGSAKVNKDLDLCEQMLHAYSLCYTHPFTQEKLAFVAPLRDDMKALILSLIPEAKAFEELQ